jgi:hypothetical protein
VSDTLLLLLELRMWKIIQRINAFAIKSIQVRDQEVSDEGS